MTGERTCVLSARMRAHLAKVGLGGGVVAQLSLLETSWRVHTRLIQAPVVSRRLRRRQIAARVGRATSPQRRVHGGTVLLAATEGTAAVADGSSLHLGEFSLGNVARQRDLAVPVASAANTVRTKEDKRRRERRSSQRAEGEAREAPQTQCEQRNIKGGVSEGAHRQRKVRLGKLRSTPPPP